MEDKQSDLDNQVFARVSREYQTSGVPCWFSNEDRVLSPLTFFSATESLKLLRNALFLPWFSTLSA
jgi:hypothetical protein